MANPRSGWKLIGRWLFGILFILAGANHFRSPDVYMKIMPPYLPFHRPLVIISGVFEMALGALLLVPQVSWLAAWGLVALLIAVFPANIYLYQHQEIFPSVSPLVHLLRLPLQGVLIWWAWVYTKRERLWLALATTFGLVVGGAAACEPPRVLKHVKVYSEPGRFAGWPANHGIWSWGDEILVGFSRGFDKDNGEDYHIDRDRPEDFLLARSKVGGECWSIEEPQPAGAMAGSRGMRHAAMPPGVAEEQPTPLREPIDFSHRDFALAVHMQSHQGGASSFFYSYNRGKSWRGPFTLPLFGQKGVMGRTDYIVEGRNGCLLFLTATKADGTEGRPFAARTSDGGLTWQFLAFIGPEPHGYAVMPSTIRVSPSDLVTTIRLRDFPRRWIDAYVSHDDGRSWSYLATPAPDLGAGNPPALARLADGRLCLCYGYRAEPFAIHARLSSDQGKTWSDPFVLRGNGGSQDIGYPRSVVRPDGKVVTVYAFHDRAGSARDIEATVWDPGSR